MKKKLLLAGAAMLLAAAAVTRYSVYNKTNVSELLNANVNALASGEGPTVRKHCGLLWGDGCYADNHGANCNTHADCSH